MPSYRRRQTFHVDSSAMRRRLDDDVEIVGSGSASAQHHDDYVTVGGHGVSRLI